MSEPARHILLLRGVMPTGKNKVPMPQLRQMLTAAGYANVRTWITTGNVRLDSAQAPAVIAADVRALIQEHLGPELAVLVTTAEQIKQMLAGQPFEDADPDRVFYTFTQQGAEPDRVAKLLATDFGENTIAPAPYGFYLHVPGSMARSSLSNNRVEKILGVPATTRNRNTLSKLCELALQ